MQSIKIILCGNEENDGIIQYLKSRDIPNAEFISRDKLSETDGNIIVIAYFRNEQEYIDEILQNSHKIVKVYEIMPFSFEESTAKSIANKAYSALTMAGIDVVKVKSDEFLKEAEKKATVKELFTSIAKYVYEDIYQLFVDIDDIKANMINYTKEHPIVEFTCSHNMMMLTDEFGMTPAMYFVLHDREFMTDCLSSADRKALFKQKNIFGHSILDIACLSSFEKFKDIIIEFDFDNAQYASVENENDSKKSSNTKKAVIGIGTVAAAVGALVITKNPKSLKIAKNAFKVAGGSAAKSAGKRVAKSGGKKVAKFGAKKTWKIAKKFIGETSNTLGNIGSIHSVLSVCIPKHEHKNSSVPDTDHVLKTTFNINRQQVIYDIENTQEDSALLEAYKRKIYAIKGSVK